MRLAPLLKLIVSATFSVMCIAPVSADDTATQRGPAIGERVTFVEAMPSHEGTSYELSDLHGSRGTALMFNRSLAWCPFCKKQTEDLIANAKMLRDAGYGIAVITYDAPAVLTKYAKKQKPSFPLLSDTNSETIKSFGLLNEDYEPGSFAYGIPHPMIVIVGTDNTVKAKFAEEGYKVRPVLRDVVAALP